jgi:adenylate cyclase class 2
MKVREEHETTVADGDALLRTLEGVGLHPWFRYQKFREEYAAPGVTIAIDETPVGTFIEIEGSEEGILATARALGCSEADFILDSYRGLFVARRDGCGMTGADMVFPGHVALDGHAQQSS